jgi:predicted alpha-1,2-mannosidase
MPVGRAAAVALLGQLVLSGASGQPAPEPAAFVHPLVGSAAGGNTFPGAVLPFGMIAWSPENTRGDATRAAAPGGYRYDAARIRGFSLTHLSGTGCRGASGDIPFMPYVGDVTSSPSLDTTNAIFASGFSHEDEHAEPGRYRVRLASGVGVDLTVTTRSGAGRFTYPEGPPAAMLVRTSDSEVGSSDAEVDVNADARTITGSVTSGNFCGYLSPAGRHSYYTLHFVAVFDQPFRAVGTWADGDLHHGVASARGGTTYGSDGYPAAGNGSGAFVTFDPGSTVGVRVGISYVSLDNARANLAAEQPDGSSFDSIAADARARWNAMLGRIDVTGGSEAARRIFYSALYHALLHMNVFSDTNGDYAGFDGRVHRIHPPQRAQYANFSGWDVYRSQLQLVTLLDPAAGADMAQSLLNQAAQNEGVWDRWTHASGATAVMEGDPSPAAVASIAAFGGTTFDVQGAYASLRRAATQPTALDTSDTGCPIMCRGQRASLDLWLRLHYIPDKANAWGGAGETLEDATADFALAQLAVRTGDAAGEREFLARSGYWRNLFNPTPTIRAPERNGRGRGRGGPAAPGALAHERPQPGGYVQDRHADGTWPPLVPSSSDGFAEGSAVQYTWTVPFDVAGLVEAMGGTARTNARLDAFFKAPDGTWTLTKAGGLHAELDNEPSLGTPFVYLFTGEPWKAQEIVRHVQETLWKDAPDGIPGNDDLGEMSSWFVWTAMGLYPGIPGRAELFVTAPLFDRVVVRRGNGKTITIDAQGNASAPYIQSLDVNGRPAKNAWLPESFVTDGGELRFTLGPEPARGWASESAAAPPSFAPGR